MSIKSASLRTSDVNVIVGVKRTFLYETLKLARLLTPLNSVFTQVYNVLICKNSEERFESEILFPLSGKF